jgi:hypothetical protein
MNGQMLSKICSDIEIEGSDKLLMGTKIFNSIKHFGMRKLVQSRVKLGVVCCRDNFFNVLLMLMCAK